MNLACVDQIARAVLYEGYMLYPYRPSSVKNQQRWSFGVVSPATDSEDQEGQADSMLIECLVNGSASTLLDVRVRFLHLRTRFGIGSFRGECRAVPEGWQEATERELILPVSTVQKLCLETLRHDFDFGAETMLESDQVYQQWGINGTISVAVEQVRDNIFKVRVQVHNTTPRTASAGTRDEILMRSLVSTHTILGVDGGEFVSLLEPPPEVQELVARCQNVGAWPVLVGASGQRDTLLASPIILYDYPQIAPESAGDLFDGTEIDEILSLRIMTLTDEEKREIRESDERARQILERTDAMPPEQFMKLHGAMRSLRPLGEETP